PASRTAALPWGMVDLDRDVDTATPAALTSRAQSQRSQLPRECLIGTIEPELPQLAEQHGPQHVRIVREPCLQIRPVGLQHACSLPLQFGLARQIGPDGLAIPTGVTSDRRDRPAPT